MHQSAKEVSRDPEGRGLPGTGKIKLQVSDVEMLCEAWRSMCEEDHPSHIVHRTSHLILDPKVRQRYAKHVTAAATEQVGFRRCSHADAEVVNRGLDAEAEAHRHGSATTDTDAGPNREGIPAARMKLGAQMERGLARHVARGLVQPY